MMWNRLHLKNIKNFNPGHFRQIEWLESALKELKLRFLAIFKPQYPVDRISKPKTDGFIELWVL